MSKLHLKSTHELWKNWKYLCAITLHSVPDYPSACNKHEQSSASYKLVSQRSLRPVNACWPASMSEWVQSTRVHNTKCFSALSQSGVCGMFSSPGLRESSSITHQRRNAFTKSLEKHILHHSAWKNEKRIGKNILDQGFLSHTKHKHTCACVSNYPNVTTQSRPQS